MKRRNKSKLILLLVLLAFVSGFFIRGGVPGLPSVSDKIQSDMLAEAMPHEKPLGSPCVEVSEVCEVEELDGVFITVKTKNHYYEVNL